MLKQNQIFDKTKPLNRRAQSRYDKILSSALKLFLEKGFENTSLNDVIEKSGGSLATIYKYFENKEGLFKAIIDSRVKRFYDKTGKKFAIKKSLCLEDFLIEFGVEYMKSIFSKENILITKMLLAQGFKADSNLGRIYYENGIKKANDILTHFFLQPHVKIKFKDDNVADAGFRFCTILREPMFLHCIVLNEQVSYTPAQIRKLVKKNVDIFLNGEIMKA